MESFIAQLSLVEDIHTFMCPNCFAILEFDTPLYEKLRGLAYRCLDCDTQAKVPYDHSGIYDDAQCLRFLPSK